MILPRPLLTTPAIPTLFPILLHRRAMLTRLFCSCERYSDACILDPYFLQRASDSERNEVHFPVSAIVFESRVVGESSSFKLDILQS